MVQHMWYSSELNKYIKQLFKLARFINLINYTRHRCGATIELKKLGSNSLLRFCDVATTHTMPRTAITTKLRLGMPEEIVRQIGGHSAGGKDFYRYVQWSKSNKDKEIDDVFEKLQSQLI